MSEILRTPEAVIDALGGLTKTGRRLNQSAQTVSEWRRRNRIPPEHFLIVNDALADLGKKAAPNVFGMTPIAAA